MNPVTESKQDYNERLEDSSLLVSSVKMICRDGHVDLAVPVGGTRKGGYICCSSLRDARTAMDRLSKRQGFPFLRVTRALSNQYANTGYTVSWGEEPPALGASDYDDIVANGRFYGYSDYAIREYLEWYTRMHNMTSAPAVRGKQLTISEVYGDIEIK